MSRSQLGCKGSSYSQTDTLAAGILTGTAIRHKVYSYSSTIRTSDTTYDECSLLVLYVVFIEKNINDLIEILNQTWNNLKDFSPHGSEAFLLFAVFHSMANTSIVVKQLIKTQV